MQPFARVVLHDPDASPKCSHSVAPGTNAGGVLKKGEKLFLEQKVDPSLIGGFVIDIGALQHVNLTLFGSVKAMH